jgi:4-hydroxy-tetrahydrodipicolinate reductase
MPERTRLEDVTQLLESGINITTTRTEFYNPARLEPEIRERIEAACEKGNSSIHASGSSPGFITEALPIVLTSVGRRLDFLMIDEYAQCLGGVVSEEMLTTTMGFGDTPEEFSKRDLHARGDEGFIHSLSLIASAFGLPIERFELASEVAVARSRVPMGGRAVEIGQVAAQRVVTTGFYKGQPLMQFRANWYVSEDIEPHWDLLPDSGWRVTVQGDVPLSVTVAFPVTPEDRVHAFAGLTAHRPVNAISAICAARPGIITTTELPQVIAKLLPPKNSADLDITQP